MKPTENSRVNSLVRRYFDGFLAPKAKWVFGLCVLVTLLAVWIIATQWNINSDFKALLPENSKAALAMTEVGERIGSGSALFVVIDSPDKNANRKFAKVFSETLLKKKTVALAHYHNDKTFFEKNQLLYLEAADLAKLRKRLKKKIRREKQKANPLFIDLGGPKKKDSNNDFVKTSDLGQSKKATQNDYKTYLESDDGYSLTIIVRFVESSTDLTATNTLLDNVRSIGKNLNPTSFHPDMKIQFGGGLVNRQKEYKSIVNDILMSAGFTIFSLFLVLGLYFRRLRAIFLILTPLIMGILWSFAAAFLIYGELTIITVFIFAILLGLGIDFAIHLLASYDKRRAEGSEPVEALIETYVGTGTATVYGALTTFATFIVLSFAQFRGLSQFGMVASIGVICSLVAMFTMLPAAILVLQNIRPAKIQAAPHKESFVKTSLLLQRGAIFSLIIALLISAFSFAHWTDLRFEENFRKIGKVDWPWQPPRRTEANIHADDFGEYAADYLILRVKEIRELMDPKSFVSKRAQNSVGDKYSSAVGKQQTSTPTIMLFDNVEATQKVQNEITERMSEGKIKPVRAASSIYAFMPGTQEEQKSRLEEIAKIRSLLDKEGTSFLDKKQKKRVQELRNKLVDKPVTIYDLPEWSKRLFKEAGAKAKQSHEGEDFAFEYTIFINESGDSMDGKNARRFLKAVVNLAEETGEDIRVASPSFIYVSMLDEIRSDGLRMITIGLGVVFLLLIIAFRSPIKAIFAYSPLLLGAAWMFGLLAFFGIRLDFFNIIILPVVIGIGIDDGVHFYHRYLELNHKHALAQTWREVGSAVAMTSLTSIIGFGGLAITNHFGLKSIGFVAITGILSTLFATVLVMPAMLYFAEKFDIKVITKN